MSKKNPDYQMVTGIFNDYTINKDSIYLFLSLQQFKELIELW